MIKRYVKVFLILMALVNSQESQCITTPFGDINEPSTIRSSGGSKKAEIAFPSSENNDQQSVPVELHLVNGTQQNASISMALLIIYRT
jgi:hypothetical protein